MFHPTRAIRALTPVVLTTLCCMLPLQASASSAELSALAESDKRSEQNRARNTYRHPAETLSFFGIKPDMTVVELWPGGGWYTEILAPYLKQDGQLIAANFKTEDYDPDDRREAYFAKSGKRFLQMMKDNHDWWGEVRETKLQPPELLNIANPGEADMVLTFRNLHNWEQRGHMQSVFAAAFKALKEGGVFGVVEHRAPFQADVATQAKTGYLSEQHTIEIAQKVGFVLQARSEINANPKDTKDHPKGVWTLPPRMALGDEDKEKYLAIGESDRMTLKFVKPATKSVAR